MIPINTRRKTIYIQTVTLLFMCKWDNAGIIGPIAVFATKAITFTNQRRLCSTCICYGCLFFQINAPASTKIIVISARTTFIVNDIVELPEENVSELEIRPTINESL